MLGKTSAESKWALIIWLERAQHPYWQELDGIAQIQSHELLLKHRERSHGTKEIWVLMKAQNFKTKSHFFPDSFLVWVGAAPLNPIVLYPFFPQISLDLIFRGFSDLEQGQFERGTNSGGYCRVSKDTHVVFQYMLSPVSAVVTILALNQAGRGIS